MIRQKDRERSIASKDHTVTVMSFRCVRFVNCLQWCKSLMHQVEQSLYPKVVLQVTINSTCTVVLYRRTVNCWYSIKLFRKKLSLLIAVIQGEIGSPRAYVVEVDLSRLEFRAGKIRDTKAMKKEKQEKYEFLPQSSSFNLEYSSVSTLNRTVHRNM